MGESPMDAVDRAILYQLQSDARQSITAIADYANVSDNTVRNRIQNLEERGVIRGFSIDVDYTQSEAQHYYQFLCTTRVSKREELGERAREIPGVVEVRTRMSGVLNVVVTAVAEDVDEITDIAFQVDELGLEIEHGNLIRTHERQPLESFRLGIAG